MIAVVTILAAFPLGFFLSNRLAANTTYAVAYLWAFVFQAIYLMPDFLDQSQGTADEAPVFPWAYGLVTLAIFVAGFGLVQLGHRVGRGRRQRRHAGSGPSRGGAVASVTSGSTTAQVAR